MKCSVYTSVVLLANCVIIIQSEGVSDKLTSTLLKTLKTCQSELGLKDSLLTDMYHIWEGEYDLIHRDTGCAIVCMSEKLGLLDENGEVNQENAQEFAINHGVEEEVATELVAEASDCVTEHKGVHDECLRALEIVKCIRSKNKDLDWTPPMGTVNALLPEVVI